MKYSQKGSTSGVLLVVVVILIAVIGYFVFTNNVMQQNERAENASENSTTTPERDIETFVPKPASNAPKDSVIETELETSFFPQGNTLTVFYGEKVVQTIELESEAVDAIKLLSNDSLSFIADQDVNFDGRTDVGVFTATGYAGVNNFYDFYIFNPKTHMVEKSPVLLGISNPVIDPYNKLVKSNYRSGAEMFVDTYKFNGASYTKTTESLPMIESQGNN